MSRVLDMTDEEGILGVHTLGIGLFLGESTARHAARWRCLNVLKHSIRGASGQVFVKAVTTPSRPYYHPFLGGKTHEYVLSGLGTFDLEVFDHKYAPSGG